MLEYPLIDSSTALLLGNSLVIAKSAMQQPFNQTSPSFLQKKKVLDPYPHVAAESTRYDGLRKRKENLPQMRPIDEHQVGPCKSRQIVSGR